MALNYELEALESLIKETMHPKILLPERSITSEYFEALCQTLYQEKDIFRKRLKKVTYTYSKEHHRKLYIHQHQFVIHLKNILMGFLSPKNATELAETIEDSRTVKLYKRSLAVLQELSGFIKEEFPQYFNYNEKVPANKLLQLQEGLKTRLSKLKRWLAKCGQDTILIDLVVQTILTYSTTP
jgi:hypothetical protein